MPVRAAEAFQREARALARVSHPNVVVVHQPGEALDRALDELEWTRWLSADQRGYTFVAGITRDIVATDLLTAGRRERLRALAGNPGPS